MRILFLSNYFPPNTIGGYEQLCYEVAEELVRRGSELCVLTSHGFGNTLQSTNNGMQVHRSLHLEVESGLLSTTIRLLRDRKLLEAKNLSHVEELINSFAPQLALIWGAWNLPRSVPACIEGLLPGKVAYYICDYWLTLPSAYLQQLKNPSKRLLTRLPKRLVAGLLVRKLERDSIIPLRLEHPVCVSKALRERLVQSGLRVSQAPVIPVGTRLEQFLAARDGRDRGRDSSHGLRLVYVGRLTPDKGVHTAIQALARLPHDVDHPITLDIYGRGDRVYERRIDGLARKHQLSGQVSFRGTVPQVQLPDVLVRYDALLFPSEWEEPFARIVLEAMAAGLVVIGTDTGGTPEILTDEETGLVFPAGAAQALADRIMRLKNEVSLREKLSWAARTLVSEKFTLNQMVDKLEEVFEEIIN